MRSKEYTINIRPIPWSRAGHNGNHFYDKQHQEKLAYGLCIAQQHGNDPIFTGPLQIEMIFYIPIPKLKRNRTDGNYHYSVPDADNFCKFLMDAITQTQVVWHDDKQCSLGSWAKLYDKNPRVYFKITELA